MNIFVDLPFEFLGKLYYFHFGMTKFIFIIYDCYYRLRNTLLIIRLV